LILKINANCFTDNVVIQGNFMQKNFIRCKRVIVLLVVLYCAAITAINEHRLIIDIPSYNNKDWCIKNLRSVLDQVGHTNYCAIVTDDCSPDGTGEILEKYIKTLPQEQQDHVKLIRNKHRRGALANHYNVIQLAQNDDIIVQLDGDDFFKTTDVFTFINNLYNDPDLWWTYGIYENWPNASMPAFSRPLTEEDGFLRSTVPFVFGPIRSYRAWFAKKIKLEDLIATFEPCLGKFYGSAGDFALIYPLLEMANNKHLYYIDKSFYTRNVATPINDFKVNKNLQERCARAIKDSAQYIPVCPPDGHAPENIEVSVIVFDGTKDVAKLEQCLSSIRAQVSNYKIISVLYDSEGATCSSDYRDCVTRNTDCRWIDVATDPVHAGIRYGLRMSYAPYVFLLDSSCVVTGAIDMQFYANMLKNTSAYTVAFGVNKAVSIPHEWLDRDMFIWKFALARDQIHEHSFGGNLYKFGDVISIAKRLTNLSLNLFMDQWIHEKAPGKKVGLYLDPVRVAVG
jgi:hypothetical protein